MNIVEFFCAGTSSESSSVWYVENQVDLTMKPPELSSLPMMTPSGLQHTVLSALAQSDPTPIFESSFVQSGQSKQESRKTQPMGTFEYCVSQSCLLSVTGTVTVPPLSFS